MSSIRLRSEYIENYLETEPDTMAVVDPSVKLHLAHRRPELDSRLIQRSDLDITDVFSMVMSIHGTRHTPETIVGFGGGRALDSAKHLATIHDLNLVLIPTALSTMSYLTSHAILYDREASRYENVYGQVPDDVIVDKLLLDTAVKENIRGVASIAASLSPDNESEEVKDELAEIMSNLRSDIDKTGWWQPIHEGLQYCSENYNHESMSHTLAHYFALEHNRFNSHYGDLLELSMGLCERLFNDWRYKFVLQNSVRQYNFPITSNAQTVLNDFSFKRFLAFTRLNGVITPLEQYDIYV